MKDDSAQLFQLLVESSPDGIVRHDSSLRCVYVNSTFVRSCGQPLETLIGTLPQEWPLIFDAPAYVDCLTQTLSSGAFTSLELAWHSPDGARRWSQVRFAPERDAQGEVVGAVSVAHDITALKETQAKLERGEQLARIGFWEVDLVTRTSRCSRHASEMIGLPEGSAATIEQLLELHTPTERERVQRTYADAMARHERQVRFDYFIEQEGRRRHFQSLAEIEYSPKGQPQTLFAVSRDITEQVEMVERLRQHEQESRVLVETTLDVIARYDLQCRRSYANPALRRLMPGGDWLGSTPTQINSGPAAIGYEEALRQAMSTGQAQEYKYRWVMPGSRDRTMHMQIVPERDAKGDVVSVLAIGRDITALEESERRLEDAQRVARVCYWEWDVADQRSSISQVGMEVLGFTQSTMTLQEYHEFMPAEERHMVQALYKDAFLQRKTEFTYEHGLIMANDERRDTHNWVRIQYDPSGRAMRVSGVTQDVTDLKKLQRQTHQLEFYDLLTSLPNRALLHDRLKLAMQEAARQSVGVGLVLLDVDHFQKINDSLGSNAGDVLLKLVAERLSHALRDYDTVARMGGDEFAIIVPQIRQPSDLDMVASRIKKVFESPLALADAEVVVTASAGISMYPSDGTEVDELLAHADSAMHHAKNCGRDNFQFYARELTATALERLKIEGDLRKAIERNELELFYQPKVALSTGRVAGAEALMRWRHPERGLVPPDRFIGIAEDTGLIIEMGAWALRTVCATARQWHDVHGWPLKIAVNLSPRQFEGGDLVGTVQQALADTGCQPEWIELEITESLLLNDRVDIRSMLEQLHAMGLSIAIDDFGTGYSALSYLTRFPVDTLKIDRSFIRELTLDRDSAVLAQAIVTLARSLRMQVVAEGVETESQRDHLDAWGCQMVQGFLYSKPVPLSEFTPLIAQWQHR